MSLNTVKILGIPVVSALMTEVLRKIEDFMANSSLSLKMVIFTPNPEFLVEASRSSYFKEILNKADINIPDGIGLVWASRLLGCPIKERISGADLAEKLLEEGNKEKWEVGVTGSRRGNVTESEELIKKLQEKYPSLRIVNLDKNGPNSQLLITNYFDIVLACHGMLKQEKWIWENKDKITAKIFMGVGGSLDFLTGFSKRAPIWMRRLGLEWLWRGLQRPGHWQRMWRATVVFGWMVFKEKIKS